MTLPTPRSDPGGLAALAVALIAAVFAALDPSGVLGDRWAPVVAAGLALVAVLAARSKAYAPANRDEDVAEAATLARLDEIARCGTAIEAAARRPLVADGRRGGQQAPSRVVTPPRNQSTPSPRADGTYVRGGMVPDGSPPPPPRTQDSPPPPPPRPAT